MKHHHSFAPALSTHFDDYTLEFYSLVLAESVTKKLEEYVEFNQDLSGKHKIY